MSRIHVYADESGNFDFTRGPGATRYFVLTTVSFFDDRQACADLDELKYEFAWSGDLPVGPFHAAEDRQAVRDRVFSVLQPHDFRVDSTVIEKSKSQPQIRSSDETFYKYAWFYHMKYVFPRIAPRGQEVLVITSSIGTKKKQDAFGGAVDDVMAQLALGKGVRTTHWPAATDPGLQIADYCCWAIFRKWERDDDRSYKLIRGKIKSAYDLFSRGTTRYY